VSVVAIEFVHNKIAKNNNFMAFTIDRQAEKWVDFTK